MDKMPGDANIYGVILAGGNGTRLWPLSRKELPKQFLALDGERSLLQNTILRLAAMLPKENIRIVAGREWRDLVCYQAAQAGASNNLLIEESEGRNTAPAIALAIATLIDEGASPEDIAIVAPSDHIIKEENKFREAVMAAIDEAARGSLVVFGVTPNKPETGFGYIKTAEAAGKAAKVLEFVEKPDLQTAEKYLKANEAAGDGTRYCWNAGILCFRLKDMASSLEEHFPECGRLIKGGAKTLAATFSSIPSMSIDYAVMERAGNIACVFLDAGWSNAGSWDSVWKSLAKDTSGNATAGDVMTLRSANSLLISKGRLMCAADVEGIIAVDTPDALFIASRGSSQNVREAVEALKMSGRREAWQTPESARPWGTYRILSETATDKIKRISVSPHKRISLQYHNRRSEHWIVVKGLATVTLICADDSRKRNVMTLGEGESCFVPAKMLHRLENCTDEPLEIIEVQTGDYLGEDDIVRVNDDFGRSGNC